MKADELKQYEVFVSNPYSAGGSFREIAVLPSDKVDATIAELKQKLHDAESDRDWKDKCLEQSYQRENDLKQKLHDAEMAKDLAEAANTEYREDIKNLKDENAELKFEIKQIEDNFAIKAKLVYDHHERSTLRALWLARAERAIAEAEYWYGHCTGMYYINAKEVPDEEYDSYKRVKDTTIGWYKTWMNVERICREKAEEYQMSELKSVYIDRTGDWVRSGNDTGKYYLKSEADKVIAEKDKEIVELKALKAQAEDDCAYWKMSERNAANAMHETEEYAMQLHKELRRQKHKWCLGNAEICFLNVQLCIYDTPDWPRGNVPFWRKWYHTWLELAEKFKEAK